MKPRVPAKRTPQVTGVPSKEAVEITRVPFRPAPTAKAKAGSKKTVPGPPSRTEENVPILTPQERFFNAKNHAASKAVKPGVVSKLLFHISSSEEIRGFERCKVESPAIDENVAGCLLDPQMGPHDDKNSCLKCGKTLMGCPGHAGYISFSVPIYHPAFVKSLVKILGLFCFTHWRQSKTKKQSFISEYVSKWRKENPGKPSPNPEDDPDCPKIDVRPCFDVLAAKNAWGRIYGESKLTLIEKSRHCAQCTGDAQKVKYTLKDTLIQQEIGNTGAEMDPSEVKKFLADIDDDTDAEGKNMNWAEVIGFGKNRLENIVMEYFPVLSNIHRPSKSVAGKKEAHHFTLQYQKIVNANVEIRKVLNEEKMKSQNLSDFAIMHQKAQHWYRTLNEEIYRLIFESDNTENQAFDTERRNNSVVVSFATTIKGKPGILRRDILGKGSDFSARAVLIGDTNIDVDEVGISKVFAETITIPETIASNEDVQKWSKHMPKTVDGVRVVGWIKRIEREGRPIYLENNDASIEIGDVVRRSVVSGDVLVITRQPVLHKGGLMGFKAVVFEEGGNVIRINPAVTGPFNADFDGDEMNFAVPQELKSRQETLKKMMVTNCVRGDQFSAPWIGLIQNAIVAGKQLTERSTILDDRIRNLIIGKGEQVYSERNPGGVFRTSVSEFLEELYSLKYNLRPNSGRAAVSYFFPRTFNYERSPEKKEKVIVENGFLVSGVLDKNDLGKASGGMVDAILQQYGPEVVIVFLSAITRGLYEYIESVGFTLGATDCVLLGEEGKPDPQNTIDDLIDDMRTSVEKLLKSAGTGTLAKQAQAEVDKQIAELGDRINSIVTSGGVDIVAKKKVLAEERNDSLLKDALNLVLRSSFTLSEKFPGISFLKLNRGLELTEESFKERVTPVLTAITTGKRTEVEKTLSVEIEVLKVCMAILANIGENFQDREVSVLGELTSLKAKIQTKPQIVTRLMIDRLKSSVNLRAEIIGANKFDNNFLYIVNSGAKGTASNVAQVLGSIGPQDRELIDVNPVTGRSLPFSTKWSLDPVATGFCASSFGRGMDPIEFWHHASASRGNIIESNLKPKDTGYFYRRAWVMMGDIVTHEDGSARNESGRVVQFAYGGDMFDPRSLINVKKEAQFIHVPMAVKIVRSKAGKKEFEYQTK